MSDAWVCIDRQRYLLARYRAAVRDASCSSSRSGTDMARGARDSLLDRLRRMLIAMLTECWTCPLQSRPTESGGSHGTFTGPMLFELDWHYRGVKTQVSGPSRAEQERAPTARKTSAGADQST